MTVDTKEYGCDYITEGEIMRAGSSCTQKFSIPFSEDLGVDVRIILKYLSRKQNVRVCIGLI
jgi:hypothetical protein